MDTATSAMPTTSDDKRARASAHVQWIQTCAFVAMCLPATIRPPNAAFTNRRLKVAIDLTTRVPAPDVDLVARSKDHVSTKINCCRGTCIMGAAAERSGEFSGWTLVTGGLGCVAQLLRSATATCARLPSTDGESQWPIETRRC